MTTGLKAAPEAPAYRFKSGAHIPKGVTVEGVLAERDMIVDRYGRATIRESAEAVLEDPETFHNLRAFAPETAEEAMRACVERGIQHAYASIVRVELLPKEKEEQKSVEV